MAEEAVPSLTSTTWRSGCVVRASLTIKGRVLGQQLFDEQELVLEADVVVQDETVQHLWHAHENMSKPWSTREACDTEQVRVVNVVGGT